jgi:hypothetical protein
MFTAVGTGDTVAVATWQNMFTAYTAGQPVSVFPNTPPLPTHEIFGLVWQAGSTPASSYIDGAVIQILDGLVAGRMATSGGPTPALPGYIVFDGTGRYHLLGVPPGTYHLQATRSGYVSQQVTVTVTGQGSPEADFQLQPS